MTLSQSILIFDALQAMLYSLVFLHDEKGLLLADGELGDSLQQVDVGSVFVRRAEVRQLLRKLVAYTLLFQQVH